MSKLSPSTQEIRVTLTLEASTRLNKPEILTLFTKLDLGRTIDLLSIQIQEERELYGNAPDLSEVIADLEGSFPETKICALAAHLGVTTSTIQESQTTAFGQAVYESGNQQFLILTDEEANAATNSCLDDWIENEIYASIDEEIRHYIIFDDETWKENALIDGRGHYLAPYDGCEHEQGKYFIYRIG